MDDKHTIISQFREKIRTQDKNIIKAATYGKELLEKNSQSSAEIENLLSQKEFLKQGIHSLKLNLEANKEQLNIQTKDREFQINEYDSLQMKLQIIEKEYKVLLMKIKSIKEENQCFLKAQEDVKYENELLKHEISHINEQIESYKDVTEKSMCEEEKDETQDLQAQLNIYMLNNKELQDGLLKVQYELERSKENKNHLLEMVRELEEVLSDRNSELLRYQTEIKVTKEEIEEAEIEILKSNKVDVNCRQNSVFAELDDKRHLVEKEYKVLLKKYENIRKTFDENKKELDRARGQIFILQSKTSREYQEKFINQLEVSRTKAYKEISDLIHKLTQAYNDIKKLEDKKGPERDTYLTVMLNQSQKKARELRNKILAEKNKSICEKEKLINAQNHLYIKKEDLYVAKREIVTLKQKIKSLDQDNIQNLPVETVPCKQPKVEILEGFQQKRENLGKQSEPVNPTENGLLICDKELKTRQVMSHSKVSNRRKNDNCAQQ